MKYMLHWDFRVNIGHINTLLHVFIFIFLIWLQGKPVMCVFPFFAV